MKINYFFKILFILNFLKADSTALFTEVFNVSIKLVQRALTRAALSTLIGSAFTRHDLFSTNYILIINHKL